MRIGKERPERITVPAPNEAPAQPEPAPTPTPVEPEKVPEKTPA